MNHPRGLQAAFNAASQDQWDSFAGHREKVSDLLGAGEVSRPTRLCVLGAGNCNDLDLPALLKAHREVHLVDLDPQALARGVLRQGVDRHPGLHAFEGIDVTGVLDALASWTPATTIHPSDLAALADWPARRVAPTLPRPYDLVASTCLLSQLIGNAFQTVGDRHPQFMAIVQAIRVGHLRLLSHLAGPGSNAILITDVVSSDNFPALGSLPEASLSGVIPRLARERNLINGVNPAVLTTLVREDPILSAGVAGVESVPPWRWRLHDRVYLVWAMKLRNGPANG